MNAVIYAVIAAVLIGIGVGIGYGIGENAGAVDPLAKLATCTQQAADAATAATNLVADAQAAKKKTEEDARVNRVEAQKLYASVLQQNAIELTEARAALRQARKENAQLLDTRLPDSLVCGLRAEAANCADGSGSR